MLKILLDANISWKLTNKLIPIYGECAHVDHIGLQVPASDKNIWEYALKNNYIIITKDIDFLYFLETQGYPPKVVLLRTGNNSSQAMYELLLQAKDKIEEFSNESIGLLEIMSRI